MTKKTQQSILTVIASLALAMVYFAIGFAICAGFPQITRVASMDNSAFDASPYGHDQLVSLAEETRSYTLEDAHRSEGVDVAHELFADKVLTAAFDSLSDPAKESAWSEAARNALGQWYAEGTNAVAAMDELYALDPSYALDEDALTHLDDVNEVISRFTMPLFGITLIAAFCLMALVMTFGARAAGRALLAGGCIAVGLFCVLGIWGVIGFDALFAWMHSLFFVDGSWTFPANSLLIQMYPTGFWITLGLWWLVSSCVVAAASIVIGLIITRRKVPTEEPHQPAGLQA